MKFLMLEPVFVRYVVVPNVEKTLAIDPHDISKGTYQKRVDEIHNVWVYSIEEAQGVSFLCPLCFRKNGGRRRTHGITCWSRSRGVPDDAAPGPGRWTLVGTGLEDLTLDGDGGTRSVLLTGDGCKWHGYITNGEVTDA